MGTPRLIKWIDARTLERSRALPAMREVCLALVQETYANLREGQPEPRLTVSFVREYLAQAGSVAGKPVPPAFRRSLPRQQTAMVRRALEALTREGLLVISLAPGHHKGTEARAFNPTSHRS
jgi:hypothetical protein